MGFKVKFSDSIPYIVIFIYNTTKCSFTKSIWLLASLFSHYFNKL